jgi:hypothetical protein
MPSRRPGSPARARCCCAARGRRPVAMNASSWTFRAVSPNCTPHHDRPSERPFLPPCRRRQCVATYPRRPSHRRARRRAGADPAGRRQPQLPRLAHPAGPASNRDGLVPLSDGAGTVVAIGSGVTRWRVGDRVSVNFFPTWRAGVFSPTALAIAIGGGQIDGVLSEYVVADTNPWSPFRITSAWRKPRHCPVPPSRPGTLSSSAATCRPARRFWSRAPAVWRCSACNSPPRTGPRSS